MNENEPKMSEKNSCEIPKDPTILVGQLQVGLAIFGFQLRSLKELPRFDDAHPLSWANGVVQLVVHQRWRRGGSSRCQRSNYFSSFMVLTDQAFCKQNVTN